MTMRECARLQSMGDLEHLPKQQGAAYKALGNAVNVNVIEAVARALIGSALGPERATSLPLLSGVTSVGDAGFIHAG